MTKMVGLLVTPTPAANALATARLMNRSLFTVSSHLTGPRSGAKHGMNCGCGCRSMANLRQASTKSDQELREFLNQEIQMEKQQAKPRIENIAGFSVQTDGANITLTRSANGEDITVKLNVNHAVDAEEPEDFGNANANEPSAEMACKPDFCVEIKKGETTLAFNCSFTSPEMMPPQASQESPDGAPNDLFHVGEITLYKGEWQESTYIAAGDVMDGYLYDLLMNYLEERGIDQEFAKNLIDFSTGYEHKLYINWLEELKRFIA